MPEPVFEIDLLTRADAARVVLRGAFDLEAVPEFRETVGRLHGQGVRQVVVDLRGLAFLDARGLHELHTLDAEARGNGHNLAIVRAGSHVDEPFRLTGLDEHFVFVDDPDDLTSP